MKPRILILMALLCLGLRDKPESDALMAPINAWRTSRNLPLLKYRTDLACGSQLWADQAFAERICGHVGSQGGLFDRMKICKGRAIAEIVACNARNVPHALQLWLNSPPHFRILMDPKYRRAGIGIAGFAQGYLGWFVIDFDTPDGDPHVSAPRQNNPSDPLPTSASGSR